MLSHRTTRFVSPSSLNDLCWEGWSAMSLSIPAHSCWVCIWVQGPHPSLLYHIWELCLQQATLRYWVLSSPRARPGLLLLIQKEWTPRSAFLSSKCNTFCLQPSIRSPSCCPCVSLGAWGPEARGCEALATAFAVSNEVICFWPLGSCTFCHHLWNRHRLIC